MNKATARTTMVLDVAESKRLTGPQTRRQGVSRRQHQQRDIAFELLDVLLVRVVDVPERHPRRGGGGDTGLGRYRVAPA